MLLYFVMSSIVGTSRSAADFGRWQVWLERCDGGMAFLRILDELVPYYDSFTDCPSNLQPPLGPLIIQYTCITQSYLGGWDIPSATHSMHPLFMYASYHFSFHATPTALYNGDAVRKHSTCTIIQCSITHVNVTVREDSLAFFLF